MNLDQIKKEAKEFVSSEALKKYNSATNSFEKESALTEFRARLKSITDTMKRNLIAGQVAKEVGMKKEDLMPMEEAADANHKVFIRGNRYWITEKEAERPISNFILVPQLHVKSTLRNERQFQIIDEYGKGKSVVCNSSTLTSLNEFRAWVVCEGGFSFSGSSRDLSDLLDQWVTNFSIAYPIEYYGWNEEFCTYCFSDAALIDNQLYRAESSGLIKAPKYVLATPSQEELRKDLDARPNRYKSGQTSFKAWGKLMKGVYGENGIIAVCYTAMSAYRDLYFPIMNAFPLLLLLGSKGTGKSTLARSIQRLFVQTPKGLNIHTATENALMRFLSSSSNQVRWIDEITSNMPERKLQVLKDLYDGTGRSRANKSMDNRRNEVPIRSGAVLSGQYSPEGNDNALYERCIECTTRKSSWSDTEQKLYQKLKQAEEEGLHDALIELLMLREQLSDSVSDYYSKANQFLRSEFPETKDRLTTNFSLLLSIGYFLIEAGLLQIKPFELEKLISERLTHQMKQLNITSFSQKVMDAIRWVIETEREPMGYDKIDASDVNLRVNNKSVRAHIHLNIPEDELVLFIKASRFKDHIQNYLSREGSENMSKNAIYSALKEHEYYLGTVSNFPRYGQEQNGYLLNMRVLNE